MAKKQRVKRVSREKPSTALVIREVALSQRQQQAVAFPTPQMFVKQKPGRGGKPVSFVETGYVVSRLNAVFSPAGWDFEILDQGQSERKTERNTEGEVWVRGRLVIIDHAKGYRVGKTQYGQHPIHANVPIGDAFKAAGSDCLKKCASLFGIAHDVYWKIAETEGERKPEAAKPEKRTHMTEDDIAKVRAIIKSTRSTDVLIQIEQKIKGSNIYTVEQKKELSSLCHAQADKIDIQG